MKETGVCRRNCNIQSKC